MPSMRCESILVLRIHPPGSTWDSFRYLAKWRRIASRELTRDLTARVFAEIFKIPGVSPEFFGNSVLPENWQLRRGEAQKVVRFNLFAGRLWPSKEMPQEESIELINRVRSELPERYASDKIVVFCDEATRDRAANYADASDAEIWDSGASALEFASASRACDYVFSTDSLGLHFAIAQGVPNLFYYAPTSTVEIDTFGGGVKIVSLRPDYCSHSPSADNSTLTAERVTKAWLEHIASLSEWH